MTKEMTKLILNLKNFKINDRFYVESPYYEYPIWTKLESCPTYQTTINVKIQSDIYSGDGKIIIQRHEDIKGFDSFFATIMLGSADSNNLTGYIVVKMTF